jgi:hypothetical protein
MSTAICVLWQKFCKFADHSCRTYRNLLNQRQTTNWERAVIGERRAASGEREKQRIANGE